MMLEIAGLQYGYHGTPVLKGIDLNVAAGEVVSIVGPNGAGKSTLLKCVNRILRPTAGTVSLEGRAASAYARRELARTISYVPQQTGPTPLLSVIDMVGLGRAPHRGQAPAAHDRAIVMDAIEAVGLVPLAFRLFAELSGGERQRVLIARALAQEGRLMLLDEPTNALDLRHQLDAMILVRRIVRERGTSALIAIHDLGLASRFSDRLVLLSAGRVYADGEWTSVLSPAHLEGVYGVTAEVGTANGLPYVIPKRQTP